MYTTGERGPRREAGFLFAPAYRVISRLCAAASPEARTDAGCHGGVAADALFPAPSRPWSPSSTLERRGGLDP
nr:hypothetical protein BOSE7B_150731 [Bosea sp. 7B]